MTSVEINTYLTFGYLLCGVLALIAYISTTENSGFRKTVFYALIALWIVHTYGIGLRWVESYEQGIGHAPLTNFYESMVFFGWSLSLAIILTRFKFKTDLITLLGLPLVFLIMASTFLMDHEIQPLIPALQSNWLIAHVVTCFLGYAGFAISFVAALVLIILGVFTSGDEPAKGEGVLDEIVYRAVLAGYPMLTIGIITGAIWADYAWGAYWSWDPKETWSLITWLVYSAFLHARLARQWKGLRTALLSVLGFAAVLFTYFGVNYLPGLHSYL
jgi:cytochrome c-type biogenesis protein CcsB